MPNAGNFDIPEILTKTPMDIWAAADANRIPAAYFANERMEGKILCTDWVLTPAVPTLTSF